MSRRRRKNMTLTRLLFFLLVSTFVMFQYAGYVMSRPIEILSPVPVKSFAPTPIHIPSGQVKSGQETELLASSGVGDLEPSVEEMIRWAFKDKGEKVVNEAIRVAKCESGMRPQALNDKNTNKTKDLGVFQINDVHGVNAKFLKDARVNIMVARKIYEDWKGWGAWVCARKLGIVK